MSGASLSKIDTATLAAYRQTEYRVFGNGAKVLAVLAIGQHSPELVQLHKLHTVDCSAFITACNPFSVMQDNAENAGRQALLARELGQQNLVYADGIGQHPSNAWPGEASFLVFGLRLEAARALGQRFEQNAIVWSGPEAVPELVLLR